ncbi:hypothetical protein Desdi_0296 [Desulfitobacterium dichloroeliminans LMG P-21439]|uniref:Uncharacterized protein n=1 Tax=Desulfitobacterium dichloroeliminans (strain LMG P-21439 / DCA1) TaxID=871963 RepID=L0F462_DESDL|nr:hypothetical protein [Desulfitobacterium dichloroeliminans]AGA67845.1 hypothetical protein Desdi_0296 [Desulfitobacterium dichloroeliminans LMG P-21439]
MNRRAKYFKVARDMFFAQGIWTLYFLGIIVAIQVVQHVFTPYWGGSNPGFFLSSQISTRIYMLVIGIIAAIYFPRFYVENGVTRKDAFRGIALGSLGLAAALTLATVLIGALESLLISGLNLPITLVHTPLLDIDDLKDIQNNIFANLFMSILMPSTTETVGPWGIGLLITSLSKYVLYCAGFLIGTTFSRLNFIIGIGVIYFSAFLVLAHGGLWGFPMSSFFFGSGLITLSLPIIVSLLGSLLIIGFMLWVARQISKKTPIKL